MDYQQVIGDRFRAAPEILPERGPLTNPSPERRLRDAIEPIAMHAVWSRVTNERLAGFGLTFYEGYVWGRAAALGEPAAGVVVAAFGVMEPGRVSGAYEAARGKVGRADLIAARDAATAASLRAIVGDEGVEEAAAAIRRGLEAAHATARPLFAGLRSLGWPADPAGRLWRACDLLREYRGDSHLAACAAVALDPISMNILTELWVGMPLGSYTATRGWDAAAIEAATKRLWSDGLVTEGRLTEAGYQFREEIEDQTDCQVRPIVEAIGADLESLIARLDAWSRACVAARAFPASAFKRAAG